MKILLAHPHKIFRESIRPLLCRLAPRAVLFDAGSLKECLRGDVAGIGLALISDDLPGLAGLGGVAELVRRHPTTPIALLMDRADPFLVCAALSAGVAGVIFKSISSAGLLAALRLILAGERYLPLETISAMALVLQQPYTMQNVPIDFSPAEREVVPLLRRGLCNKTIGSELGIEEAAVKARLRGIYRKIGVVNRAQAALMLHQVGDFDDSPDQGAARSVN